jgi:carboxymethylenebutenolidase|tara:strand:+ start:44344 stop:45018 length:675 start_codon:yes stop_codon:yes gene_type:complete
VSAQQILSTLTAADGHQFSAYVTGPADARRSMVVVQEIFGVNAYIRSVCDSFAGRGYRVVAPALFDRVVRDYQADYTAEDAKRGMEIRQEMDESLALEDIKAAATLLEATRRGIIGFCMGGTMSWYGASRTSLFGAAVSWYGTGIAANLDANLNCPVQLHFGDSDHAIPLEDAERIRQARPDVEVHIYQAGHGFGCTERKSYQPDAAAAAWTRTDAFFDRHLGA